MDWLGWLYVAALAVMSVFGFNMLLLTALALLLRGRAARRAALALVDGQPEAGQWPPVLVQLPLYNERFVAERVIDAVAALDYPRDRLTIQVLDDSTDDTPVLARARVAYWRARGLRIRLLHRAGRREFKAGALAAGLAADPAPFIAIFDADFVPPPNFLRRTVPRLLADPGLAMVQARWEHLNAEHGWLTRAEALALDGYFGVEQVARSQAGLLMNFNGSAGVWRRAAIEEAGGWQGDTLAEDLDLSYRAQLAGWRLGYAPDVDAPAELPTTILALKRQQYRWARGSFQVLRKLGPRLLRARLSPWRKLQGVLHLCGYLPHALMVVSLLLSLPLVLLQHGRTPVDWGVLGVAGLGPALMQALGQVLLRPDWRQRLLWYPALVLVGVGLALSNSVAAWDAFLGRSHTFMRTPKTAGAAPGAAPYAVPLDWTTWAEAYLAFYALVTGALALELAPGLAPYVFLYAASFGFMAVAGFVQSDRLEQRRARLAQRMVRGPMS